jgi:hypothetical protein
VIGMPVCVGRGGGRVEGGVVGNLNGCVFFTQRVNSCVVLPIEA